MKVSSLIEILSAAHLSAYVDGPFDGRGGIMLVAPPGTLKTTIIKLLDVFPNCCVLSDINVPTLNDMREDIANNRIRTLAFGELEKLYARHPATASNIEGILKAMVEEGFRHAAYDDQRMECREAKCLLVAGMTQQLYRRKFKQWMDDGFARRFLWSHFVLEYPDIILEAIDRWKRIRLTEPVVFGVPAGHKIEYQVTDRETKWLRSLLPRRIDPAAAYILLKKILCVLYMRYPRSKYGDRALSIIEDFSESLQPRGANLQIDDLQAVVPIRAAGRKRKSDAV